MAFAVRCCGTERFRVPLGEFFNTIATLWGRCGMDLA